MAEAQALSWRELMEKHHSTLMDEVGMRIDAERRQAAAEADAIARAEGERRVAAAQEEARQALEQEREESRQTAAEAREQAAQQREQAEADRERAKADREQAVTDARRSVADALSQSVRRLRQSSGEMRILKVLNEIAAPWALQSVVVVFENNQARAVALREVTPVCATAVSPSKEGSGTESVSPERHEAESAAPVELVFDITAAPAVVSVIESHDPVVALLSPRELSAPLADALGVDPGSRAYLFPILVRQSVVAILVAAGAVSTPQMELLCDVAAMRIEASSPAPVAAPEVGLIQISSAGTSAAAAEKPTWEDLSADDQRLHLQAQRMARLRTAEMRLYHADALQTGTGTSDIYEALQTQIDAARTEFLNTYLSKSSTMVDYLHLEILRTLAHDDDHLLGAGYPGPMV
jgi:hypothetical protein